MPQAIIDMNRVVEVSEAEEVTGHSFSLALTAADRVHFLKGTSREESKWWFDILSMFPRTNMKVCFQFFFLICVLLLSCHWEMVRVIDRLTADFSKAFIIIVIIVFFHSKNIYIFLKQTGRHKRNATFPGSKATTIISTQTQHQQSTAPNSPCLSKGIGLFILSDLI